MDPVTVAILLGYLIISCYCNSVNCNTNDQWDVDSDNPLSAESNKVGNTVSNIPSDELSGGEVHSPKLNGLTYQGAETLLLGAFRPSYQKVYRILRSDAEAILLPMLHKDVFSDPKVFECLAPLICSLLGSAYYYNPYIATCKKQSLAARAMGKKKPIYPELLASCEQPLMFDEYVASLQTNSTTSPLTA